MTGLAMGAHKLHYTSDWILFFERSYNTCFHVHYTLKYRCPKQVIYFYIRTNI